MPVVLLGGKTSLMGGFLGGKTFRWF